MNLRLIPLLLTVMLSLRVTVLAADKFTVDGSVYDRATDTQLFGPKVKVTTINDTTPVATVVADGEWGGNGDTPPVRLSRFRIPDLDRTGRYILKITHPGYEPVIIDIDPSTLSSRLDMMSLGKIYLRKEAKTLDEIVVRTSKVKFYHKGDTIVYNADAFVLAEGSMLDDLIRQMPGVELKEGGEIYANGRYVENLLLNGKDFFKGNRRMMLDNLGAYTVKDIALYERQDEMDRIMGKDYGQKHLSMDVRLKKEYNRGFLANMEGGYGSNDRYLGRLFGMWYADNARVALYGNANNLSDRRKPGQDTGFTPASMQSGDFKTYQGGCDYWAKIQYKDIYFYGNFMAEHQSIDDNRAVFTTNFLPGGDTYGYAFSRNRNKSLSLSTSHSLDIQKTQWYFKISPSFSYIKYDDLSAASSAVFSEELQEMSKDFIDNLYSGASFEILSSILNRSKDDNKRLGHDLDANLFSNGKIKMKNEADAFTYLLSGSFKRHDYDRFQRYMLNFGSDPAPTDYFDRYFDNTPNYRWSGTGAAGYIVALRPGLFLDSWYQYDHLSGREVSDLYRLENLYDAIAEGKQLGWLPSKGEYESTIDPSNSFNSLTADNTHSLNIKLNWSNQATNLVMTLPVIYRNQYIHYIRGDINTAFSRKRFFIGDASLDFSFWGRPHFAYFNYQRRASSPDLVDMVDFKNDLDPLNIKVGNPHLKDAESHLLSFTYRYDGTDIYQRYSLETTFLRNALAYGYTYDPNTGVKQGSMYNVNGNYNIGFLQYFSIYFGTFKQFYFTNTTHMAYRRSVDIISEAKLISENSIAVSSVRISSPGASMSIPGKNKVTNPSLRESLEFAYQFGNNKISLIGEAAISHFISRQTHFSDFTAKDFKYSINSNFNLPGGFGLSTDFTVYSRKGYSDRALNKTNFVWNGRLSYTVLKGQLSFMADGFDILHNLNNVFYTVNAQARTETYTNVLPRYIMLHIQWKFHKAPKKK